MNTQETANTVSKLLREGNIDEITTLFETEHPSFIAETLISLDPGDRVIVLNSMEPEMASLILLELEEDLRQDLLDYLAPETIVRIIEEVDSDDAADLVSELSENKAHIVLSRLSPKEAKEVETLLQYPEDSAGGIMQTELVQTRSSSTVRDTINWIRLIADEVEDFNEIYITNEENRLMGVLPLNRLVLANAETEVVSIMEPVEATVTPFIDQEEVANLVKKFDLLSLPVIDDSGVLLGRITADDIIDVITEEASEDIFHLAGVGDHTHPIYTSTASRLKSRLPWILLGLVGELFIALMIAQYFKPTLEKLVILAAFMPVVMATGGNVGVQVTTIVVRALGMGTLNLGQTLLVLVSELKLGLALGIISGIAAAGASVLIGLKEPQVYRLAFTVFTAMILAIIITTSIGVTVPFLLHRLKYDPAVAASPFVTMSNDIIGSAIYLFIAMLLL